MAGMGLDTILQTKPDTWQYANYSGKNFVLIELDKNNNITEYNEVVTFVSTLEVCQLSIKKIERVQHPFAYGRFQIRKHQLEKRDECTYTPVRKYCQVDENLVEIALQYNLDKRRTTQSYGGLTSSICFILSKQLKDITKRDSEIYPEYVVYYN